METVRPEDVGFSSARLRRLDEPTQPVVEAGQIAGAVTLVVRRGRVAHFAATGLLDLEARRPMEHDVVFRLASMTKPVTVTAVMMLFEEGHFLLEDPVAGFLPEFAQTKAFVRETAGGMETADLERPITIRHLLMHTSGLAGVFPEDPVTWLYAREQIGRPEETLAAGVRRLAALPLAYQPGGPTASPTTCWDASSRWSPASPSTPSSSSGSSRRSA